MSTKHTRGPWTVLPEEVDRDYIRVRGTRLGERYKVANVLTPTGEGVPAREADETRANARLIAAAPDLLDALEGLCRNFPPDVDLVEAGWARVDIDAACDAYDKARSVLAKATGSAA